MEDKMMSLQRIIVYMAVKQWGNETIQQIIEDARIPKRNKDKQIINVLNILRCNDIAYNITDSFAKALELMNHNGDYILWSVI